ncbi:hypothetical protein HMPREF0072_1236 [Anaerococcus lactolyticus ATCC 51172]|uniref:Uncharacterized protein n=1 Tax=Anaerococcus lactolyticus ATCC 51172 TaxID=525254 RepID=C2BFW6_9FIRM|nr:hypothetical protein HMPREF0072_1236 [Anaerococcus lactolyticus ATCC 51172]
MTREEVIENSAGASWVHSLSVRQKQRAISATEKTQWPHEKFNKEALCAE